MSSVLTDMEKQTLLCLARQAIESAVGVENVPRLQLDSLPTVLQENGATFVTLTIHGQLRGCVGVLDAYQSLAEDVCEHAIAAAFRDPRFAPVDKSELSTISIEISRLTAPHPLEYTSADELIHKLRPHVDGVILKNESRRATFLPQVWEKIPDPEEFLSQLCMKMGVGKNSWRDTILQVYIYQVEEFHEMN